MTGDRVLRVVRGAPTAEELAVVTAVVSAAAGDLAEPVPQTRGRWNDPSYGLRRPLHSGPGGWRATLR